MKRAGLLNRRLREQGFLAQAVALYQTNAGFRAPLDFAAIGAIVYLFLQPALAPPPPGGPAPAAPKPAAVTAPAKPSTPATSGGAVVSGAPQPAAAAPTQAAAPVSKAPYLAPYDRKALASTSEPQRAVLVRVADHLDRRDFAAALRLLDEEVRAPDANGEFLRAMALGGHSDAMQKAKSIEHLRTAAAQGHVGAENGLGLAYKLAIGVAADPKLAVEHFERAAARGHPSAAFQLGMAYRGVWGKLPQDNEKAFRLYQQAAEGGAPGGMYSLGLAYLRGIGTAVDHKLAREWMHKATVHEDPAAVYELALMQKSGVGGPMDKAEGVRLLRMSADRGYPPALAALGHYYLKPDDGRTADPSIGASYIRQAAVKRYANAELTFARLYENGEGVERNLVQAFLYYALAQHHGVAAATDGLERVRKQMSPADLETATKLVAAATPSQAWR